MPRTKERTPELREHVLRVALGLLASEGVVGFTTRKIAQQARTSTPAVYELFGDRAGLVREIFFAGFRELGQRLQALPPGTDPRADVVQVIQTFRAFARQSPVLAEVMFARPFADFDPGSQELEAGNAVRKLIVGRVRRCIEAGVLAGNETDIAHVLLSLARGLSATEVAGWLGSSRAAVDRRWKLAIDAVLNGLRP